MALACSIGGIGLNDEVVIARHTIAVPALRHLHRHVHSELTLVVGRERIGEQRLVGFTS